MLKITLTAGKIGKQEKQLKVLEALGLRKYGSSVIRANTPTIKGMVTKVHHLVTVCEVPEGTKTGKVTRRENHHCHHNADAAKPKPKAKKAQA